MDIIFTTSILLLFISLSLSLRRLFIFKFEISRNKYEISVSLDIGKRQLQADAYSFQRMRDSVMAVLVDGEGDGYLGKAAALTTARTFTKHYSHYDPIHGSQIFFDKVFKSANRNIINVLKGNNAYAMAACVLIDENRLSYGVAGNIRIGIYRKGDLVSINEGQFLDVLTKDKLNDGSIGESAAKRLSGSKKVYNFLGRDDYRYLEFNEKAIMLNKKDIVVIMTDGIYETIGFREIEEILSRGGNVGKLAESVTSLVRSKDIKEQDNMGIILIRVLNN